MSVKNQKDKIIFEIMNLRTYLWELTGKVNDERLQEAKNQLDKIQDMVFSI